MRCLRMRIHAIRNPLCVSWLKRHYGFSCSNTVELDSSTDRVKHTETIYAADLLLHTTISDHVHPNELYSIKLKPRPVSGADMVDSEDEGRAREI
jgi:hypothetical protein